MTSLAATASDTAVLAVRNLRRIPRQPDLLISFTIQPIMFVLLFRYVFGGAIRTPGYDYIDFLLPGIIAQSMTFGGFVTAIGLTDDLRKGLIDRFRSLPMARSAVLAGRTLADVVTNAFQLGLMLIVGVLIGFDFESSVPKIVAGILLLLAAIAGLLALRFFKKGSPPTPEYAIEEAQKTRAVIEEARR